MINKIVIEFHNGGFGPVSNFYTELITIKDNKINYSKTYDHVETFETLDGNLKKGYTWELQSDSEQFKKQFNNLVNSLTLELNNHELDVFICDGSTFSIKLYEGNRIYLSKNAMGDFNTAHLFNSAHDLYELIPGSEEVPNCLGIEDDE